LTNITAIPNDQVRIDRLTAILRDASEFQDKAFADWIKTCNPDDPNTEESFNLNWIPYGLLRAHDLHGRLCCLWASFPALNWGVGLVSRRWEKALKRKNNTFHAVVGNDLRKHPDVLKTDVELTPVTAMYKIFGVSSESNQK